MTQAMIDDAPWRTNPLYGGMSDEAARLSYEADQRRKAERAAREPAPAPDYDPPRATSAEDFGLPSEPINLAAVDDPPASKTAQPLRLVTPADWPTGFPPPIDWLVDQLIPRGDVTSLHGDGGAGKTDLAEQLAASVARGAPYWLGHAVAAGAVMFISAEEPEREMRRRAGLHAARDGYDVHALTELFFWFPDDVSGATLGAADRNSGMVKGTPMFTRLAAAIADLQPVLVVVDNVAATFVGNQVDRVMARGFVNLWRTIAQGPSKPAVLLLDHPSLSGITGGTGRGGNMDWRNAVRCALYLRTPDDKGEAERGVRLLEVAKSNYAPRGNPIRLQWSDGGLALEATPSSVHRIAKDYQCEEIFLRLLDERNALGRFVSDKFSKTWAPSVFAEMEGADGFASDAFRQAMERLFHARKIMLEQVGAPSRNRMRIVRRTQLAEEAECPA